MAGRGPAPAEEKRRRNIPAAMDELPAEGYEGTYPALPASYGVEVIEEILDDDGNVVEKKVRRKQVKYLHDTREWYETWACSPMAAVFVGVDWNRLQRLARLIDAYHRRPAKYLAAEIRLQESAFGGSPLDRLRAQMKIAKPAAGEEAPKKKSSRSSARKRRLSVVK